MLDVDTEQAPRPPASASPRRPRPTIAALVLESLKLGLVGFGGGLAVLSSIDVVLVARRRWLTAREFAVTATVSQMLPGGAAARAGRDPLGPAGSSNRARPPVFQSVEWARFARGRGIPHTFVPSREDRTERNARSGGASLQAWRHPWKTTVRS